MDEARNHWPRDGNEVIVGDRFLNWPVSVKSSFVAVVVAQYYIVSQAILICKKWSTSVYSSISYRNE